MQREQVIKELAMDPITGLLLQIILIHFADYIQENYPHQTPEEMRLKGSTPVTSAKKATDFLTHVRTNYATSTENNSRQ